MNNRLFILLVVVSAFAVSSVARAQLVLADFEDGTLQGYGIGNTAGTMVNADGAPGDPDPTNHWALITSQIEDLWYEQTVIHHPDDPNNVGNPLMTVANINQYDTLEFDVLFPTGLYNKAQFSMLPVVNTPTYPYYNTGGEVSSGLDHIPGSAGYEGEESVIKHMVVPLDGLVQVKPDSSFVEIFPIFVTGWPDAANGGGTSLFAIDNITLTGGPGPEWTPEPASMVLMLLGSLLGIGFLRRR